MALVALPPHKFACPPCCYHWLYGIKSMALSSNGITLKPCRWPEMGWHKKQTISLPTFLTKKETALETTIPSAPQLTQQRKQQITELSLIYNNNNNNNTQICRASNWRNRSGMMSHLELAVISLCLCNSTLADASPKPMQVSKRIWVSHTSFTIAFIR